MKGLDRVSCRLVLVTVKTIISNTRLTRACTHPEKQVYMSPRDSFPACFLPNSLRDIK